MHVVVIPTSYPNSFSPSGLFFRDQAKALAELGHRVAVIAIIPISLKDIWRQRRIWRGFSRANESGVETWRLEFPSIPKVRRFNLWMQKILFKGIARRYLSLRGMPDCCHVQCLDAAKMGLWLKRQHGIPFVVSEHSSALLWVASWSPKRRHEARLSYAAADGRIAVSTYLARLLSETFGLEFEYIPNLVDIGRFQLPLPTRRRNVFAFCSIGWLTPGKNHALLLRAYADVFRGDASVCLRIGGDGPERTALRSLARELGIEQQVEFLGLLTREGIDRLLIDSDCLVLSSKFETFGVVLIEAMAAGLGVVATRAGGPESIVTDERLGYLVPSDDVQAMSRTLQLARNRSFDRAAIRAHAQSEFSAPVVAGKIARILESARASARGAAQSQG